MGQRRGGSARVGSLPCVGHARVSFVVFVCAVGSVNRKNERFGRNVDADEDGVGSKWSLQALLKWFRDHGIDDNEIMASISDVVIKTLISVEADVSSLCGRCFRNRYHTPLYHHYPRPIIATLITVDANIPC